MKDRHSFVGTSTLYQNTSVLSQPIKWNADDPERIKQQKIEQEKKNQEEKRKQEEKERLNAEREKTRLSIHLFCKYPSNKSENYNKLLKKLKMPAEPRRRVATTDKPRTSAPIITIPRRTTLVNIIVYKQTYFQPFFVYNLSKKYQHLYFCINLTFSFQEKHFK